MFPQRFWAAYYRQLLDRDDIAELHPHLMRPWESRETIFAEKAMSLFTAAGLYGQDKERDPIRVLANLAESDAAEALAGLESVPAARRHVRDFTNGASPEAYREDRFVTSAFGNFTTRLATYQKHIGTIAPPDPHSHLVIDPDWVRQNGTVYITYSLQDLKGVGGVVAAVIAAMLRHHMRQNSKERLLVAIDELPAVGFETSGTSAARTAPPLQGEPESGQNQGPHRPSPLSDCLPASGRHSPGNEPHRGGPAVGDWARRPERSRHDGQPHLGPDHRRCGAGRVSPPDSLQVHLVWHRLAVS